MEPRVAAWASRGRLVSVAGRDVFVWETGEGRPLVALHGFPSSSYDWRLIAEALPGRRFVAFDFPGFGLSSKASGAGYSLFDQADVTEGLMADLGITSCDVIAHDMGDSVAAELLARGNARRLSFDIERCVLLNGSVFIELARLTRGQRLLLRMPATRLPFPLPLKVFRPQLRRLFHQPPAHDEIEMMEALLRHERGDRLLPVIIRYIEERRTFQDRWTSGFVDFAGELFLLWGNRDPVAVPAIADRLLAVRPRTTAVHWDDVGHWPQLEVPDRVAENVTQMLA